MGLLKEIDATNDNANGNVLNQGAVYTTVKNGATGFSAAPADSFLTPRAGFAAGTYFVRRAFTTFDLTEIKRSFQILGAALLLEASAIVNNADGVSVHLVEGTQSTSLVVADFDNLSFTTFGNVALSSLSGGQVGIVLNATGLAYLKSKAESTAKLALILSNDLVESQPTGDNEAVFQSAAGGIPPQLSIDYAPPIVGML